MAEEMQEVERLLKKILRELREINSKLEGGEDNTSSCIRLLVLSVSEQEAYAPRGLWRARPLGQCQKASL